jgi:hypothetical protein
MTAPSHETRAHSHLGASSASRWLACPGSIRMQSGIPDQTSIFAAEGTSAHELAERCLRNKFQDAFDYLGEMITVGNHQFEVTEEMAEAVNLYVRTVQEEYEPGDILFIEHRFDLSSVHAAMFGTNDAGIYKKNGDLKVLDLKYGKGYAVEAKDNVQLAFYGLGLIGVPSLKGARIANVELIIVQPRAPHKDGPVRRWVTDPVHLADFMEDLRVGALATEMPDAPLVAGEHCKFCKAAGICPALRDVAITQAQDEFVDSDPNELTNDTLSALLEKCGLIEDGIRAIRAEAVSRMKGGGKLPGWKFVASRAIRKWNDEGSQAIEKLTTLFDLDEDAVVERKLRSPAQVEKLLPKSDRAALAAYYNKTSSGVSLARATDPRPEVSPALAAADDFDPV